MPIPQTTKKYLDKRLAKYEEVAHKTVYTAYDLAQTLKKELNQIAKSLLIATDKAYVLAVVPAHMKIDLKKLKKALKTNKISIPNEQVMVKVFKVKPGAMTAFGGLHQVEVWVDKSLLKTKDVILGAGSFTDSVRMKAKDFIKMEQAKLADFAAKGGYVLQIKKKKPAKKAKKAKKIFKKKPAKRPAKRRTKKR
jgi:prolyl-tRNA editing enzyme YbaK/EbsC (Cys-tRNA(Pro) deacylase)